MNTLDHSLRIIVGAAVLAVSVAALAAPVAADEMQDARDYCESGGGQVQQRQAALYADGDLADAEMLAHSVEMCRFASADGSTIYVDLVTLWSEQPSLAAQAYLGKEPMADELTGNPATTHCSDLGGNSWSSWVDADDADHPSVAMCVFSDTSMIDDWGIAYYSGGVAQGADLAPLFRFDVSSVSSVADEG